MACTYLQGEIFLHEMNNNISKILTEARKVVNIHAVSGCKISVHQFMFCKVLHSFSNLKAHVNHPFLDFADLHVW